METRALASAFRDEEETPMFEPRRDYARARIVWQALGRRSQGQGFVEYVLIILFVALAVVLALSLLGPQIATIFSTISSAL